MLTVGLITAVLLLAYTNGANDNFKGVATLYGSGTSSYTGAIRYATFMTFLGSVAAFFIATGLVQAFSGKGLVGPEIVSRPEFMFSVALGAGLTILTATRLGLPISTTHSLLGALIGAGLTTAGASLRFEALAGKFVAPLLFSPILAIIITAIVYPAFSRMRKAFGVTSESCVCVAKPGVAEVEIMADGTLAGTANRPMVTVADEESCRMIYKGDIAGVSAQTILNALHYLSAGVVSFARGLNDAPKILGLLAAATVLKLDNAMLVIGAAMAAGGLINARRVAETMGKKITPMNHGQGFSANLVTSSLVIGASLGGMPVSTTHVSVGSLFGMGLVSGSCQWNTLLKILASWVGTLPLAALFSAMMIWLVQ